MLSSPKESEAGVYLFPAIAQFSHSDINLAHSYIWTGLQNELVGNELGRMKAFTNELSSYRNNKLPHPHYQPHCRDPHPYYQLHYHPHLHIQPHRRPSPRHLHFQNYCSFFFYSEIMLFRSLKSLIINSYKLRVLLSFGSLQVLNLLIYRLNSLSILIYLLN